MVRIFAALAFVIVSLVAFSQNKNSNIEVISDSYSFSFDQPAMFHKGQFLRVECDSIFVLNNFTFNYFKNLREMISNQLFDCSEVIDLYKNTLKENALLSEKLLLNSKETGELSQNQYIKTREYLETAQKSLTLSLEKIEKASLSLEKANKQVSRIKKRNTAEKILFGIGGIGIGILVGITVN